MLTTAGQATDRWWPLPGSSVSTSALQLLAGRPRDNSATGSPIHLHNISTYPHIYTYTPWSIRGPVWVLQTIQGSDQAPGNVGLCAWFTWLSSLPTSSLFIYTLWCMLWSTLDSPNYLYPTKKIHHTPGNEEKPRHCWIVHVCFLQAFIVNWVRAH